MLKALAVFAFRWSEESLFEKVWVSDESTCKGIPRFFRRNFFRLVFAAPVLAAGCGGTVGGAVGGAYAAPAQVAAGGVTVPGIF